MREPSDDEMFPDYDRIEEEELQRHDEALDKTLVFRNSDREAIAVPTEVVTEAERAFRAYKEHLGGKDWTDIAIAEKYPSASAARADVERYLAEGKTLVMENSQRDMLVLEVARLNALQSAFWPQAGMGHVPSGSLVLQIIKLRSQLVGLDPDKMADKADEARTVVYVPKDDDGYLAGLKKAAALADGDDAPMQDEPDA